MFQSLSIIRISHLIIICSKFPSKGHSGSYTISSTIWFFLFCSFLNTLDLAWISCLRKKAVSPVQIQPSRENQAGPQLSCWYFSCSNQLKCKPTPGKRGNCVTKKPDNAHGAQTAGRVAVQLREAPRAHGAPSLPSTAGLASVGP